MHTFTFRSALLGLCILVNCVAGAAQEGVTKNVMEVAAREGETLAQMAARINASVEELAKLNGLPADARLTRGRLIKVPVPGKATNREDTTRKKEAEQRAAAPACTLTLAQPPELRGLKLGMGYEKAAGLLPRLANGSPAALGLAGVDVPDETGFQSKTIYAPHVYSEDGFEGVDELKLSFLDGRLVEFNIKYDRAVQWRKADDFVAKIAPSLGLPTAWTPVSDLFGRDSARSLTCDGFEVTATVESRAGQIAFRELGIYETRQQRRKKLEEQKREGFKP